MLALVIFLAVFDVVETDCDQWSFRASQPQVLDLRQCPERTVYECRGGATFDGETVQAYRCCEVDTLFTDSFDVPVFLVCPA